MGNDKVGRKYVTGVFPGKRENEKKRNPSRRVGAGGVWVMKKEESRRGCPVRGWEMLPDPGQAAAQKYRQSMGPLAVRK